MMQLTNKAWRFKRNIAPYIFIAPFFILFSIFMLYPILFSFRISLTKWDGMGTMKWVGFNNYIKLLSDPIFIQTIKNGIVMFLMYVPLMILLALIFAVILNNPSLLFKKVFRSIIFIPNVTSVVAIALVFSLAFDTKYGFINAMLGAIGISPISWVGSAFGSRFMISTLVLWRWVGYNMILMLSGLQSISEGLYEAAAIDGAGPIRRFFSITVPLMRPVILFCSILSTIGTFGLFTEPLLLTNGGPFYMTTSTVLYIYNESFVHLRMGYASSIAYVYFILMLIFTFIQFKISSLSEK